MKWMRYSARLLVIVWATLCILFVAGSALSWRSGHAMTKDEQLTSIKVVAGVTAGALGCVYLAFRPALIAGIGLSAIGLFLLIWRISIQPRLPHTELLVILLLLGGPPLVAGILFLLSYWKTKSAG
jgi:hypothetical protein